MKKTKMLRRRKPTMRTEAIVLHEISNGATYRGTTGDGIAPGIGVPAAPTTTAEEQINTHKARQAELIREYNEIEHRISVLEQVRRLEDQLRVAESDKEILRRALRERDHQVKSAAMPDEVEPDVHVSVLDLPPRVYNLLIRNKIEKISELEKAEKLLHNLPRFGPSSRRALTAALKRYHAGK
jgi:hypothetical protein